MGNLGEILDRRGPFPSFNRRFPLPMNHMGAGKGRRKRGIGPRPLRISPKLPISLAFAPELIHLGGLL